MPSSYELAITDPDFKFPQTWRTNIATDIKLPLGFLSTLEFIYNQEINGIGYFNANLPKSNAVVYGPATDVIERPRFTATRINNNVVNAIVLDNTNNGYGYSLAASIEKPFANGFFVKAAYNFGVSKNTVDPGSIAAGSYNNNLISWDPNNAPLAFSNNDQRHRFIFATSYKIEYKKLGSTQIGLFLEGRNQGRTSYFYSTDLNGDGNVNDLIYIHKNMAEMNFVSYDPDDGGPAPTYSADQQKADWEYYIRQDKYLRANRGKFAERNGVIFPWVWSADLNITQEFYIYTGGKRNVLQFTMNIINVTNLINSNWGVGWVINNNRPISVVSRTANPATYRLNTLGVKSDGTIIRITETFSRTANITDVWSAQFGIRYIFN